MSVYITIERVARESYGRLLAFLTARNGDLAAAEDALAEAFRNALESWAVHGIPEKPEAWLLVVARRRLTDSAREAARYVDLETSPAYSSAAAREITLDYVPDERLQMLFLCTHPAIDKALHTPLMLQAVLGLSADRIASAFLVRPTTMGQRLTRAKTKIKQAQIRFTVPERSQMPSRLNAVLEAVYAAYGTGWDGLQGSDIRLHGLAAEAVYLGRLLTTLLPDEAEVHGLAALMLYCESRTRARRSEAGEYIPLAEQSVELWDHMLIAEAEYHLDNASRLKSVGRFQLEAAIQSAHAHRIKTGSPDWSVIADLYDALAQIAPTTGVQVSRAAAIGEAHGADAGLQSLSNISPQEIASYQPYWALSAHLNNLLGMRAVASAHYRRAAGLCEDAAVRRFLIGLADACGTSLAQSPSSR